MNCFKKKRFYLYIFRESGREGEKKGGKHQWRRDTWISCFSYIPDWGPGPQSRHVPWLGIEPMTFQFTRQCSTHWATSARHVICDTEHLCPLFPLPVLLEFCQFCWSFQRAISFFFWFFCFCFQFHSPLLLLLFFLPYFYSSRFLRCKHR